MSTDGMILQDENNPFSPGSGMQRPMNTVSPHNHPPAVGSPGMVPSPQGQQQPRLGSPQPMMGPPGPFVRPTSGKEMRMQRMRPPGTQGSVGQPGQPQPPQSFRMRPPGSPVTYPGGSPAHPSQGQFNAAMSPGTAIPWTFSETCR